VGLDDESSNPDSPLSAKPKRATHKPATSSGTLSSDDSSSDSGSDETPKAKHPKVPSNEKHSKASVSSVDRASDKVNAANKINRTHHKVSSSSSGSDSDSDCDDQHKTISKSPSKAKAPSSSSSSSSEESESESESQPKPQSKKGDAVKVSTAKKHAAVTQSNSKVEKDQSTSSLQDTKTRVDKEQRTDVGGNSMTAATTGRKHKTSDHLRSTDNRFTRVNSSKIQPAVNNSYVAKVC
jgi:clumping factor A